MKPFGPTAAFASDEIVQDAAIEAAPARNRVRFLAIGVFIVLLLLAGRAVQLAFSGDPLAQRTTAPGVEAVTRADLVDRNGVLLATTVRAFALTAEPARVWDAPATAAALVAMFPELDRERIERRLTDTSRNVIYLHRGLTPGQREQVLALGLAGIGFVEEDKRIYPHRQLAAHALGFTDVDLNALAGVEIGMDQAIRNAGAAGRPVRLSLDIRAQFAVEEELAAAAARAGAASGSAILLDGRTGETLALASWPTFDPNQAGAAPEDLRRDRVAGDLHELGSTMKPFTMAMALEEGVVNASDTFDLSQPFLVDGDAIEDHERIVGSVGLGEMLARSSNIGAARLALRLGGERQRQYLQRLGLLDPPTLELARRQAPIAPQTRARRDVAGLGFGYGLATTPAALAGAYTVFTNEGARVAPTLVAHAEAAPIQRTPVFSPEATARVVTYLRQTVTDGTGRAADVAGLEIAGKTGTAEKLGDGAAEDGSAYDESRNFSSFAAIFPASDPRYVLIVALDEVGAGGAGGAVAAPAAGRIAERVAPMLGLRVAER